MSFFTDLVTWLTSVGQGQVWLLALGIFCARIADQSFGTMRTISIFRGFKVLAAIFGFLEVLIWINVVAQVITNLDEWYLGVVYAAGLRRAVLWGCGSNRGWQSAIRWCELSRGVKQISQISCGS
jgi:hypothetical protein